jgi:hypothetical protein
MISSGLGGWTHDQLWSQYTSFKAYKNMNLINTISILSYNLQENGTIGVYQTNDSYWNAESYQQFLKQKLGIKATPCIYCDATIGMCPDLSSRLENLYLNSSGFINDTIYRANIYGWDGYIVDFEPDSTVNTTKLTDFIFDWSEQLETNGLSLTLWIGGNTPYDDRIYNSSKINLITMNTYSQSYEEFISVAAPLQTSVIDITKLGFGLLTNYYTKKSFGNVTDDSDIMEIIKWSILTKSGSLSLWASHIPPDWYEALQLYLMS